MPTVRYVLTQIDVPEAVQAELARVASRTDDQRRFDLIELRRKLSDQIAAIRSIAEPLFIAKGDAALLQSFREKLSAIRSAAAIHQASWPAVSLGERDAEYRSSALSVREANRLFVAWMRETLPGLERVGRK
jgi:hypothetical protein